MAEYFIERSCQENHLERKKLAAETKKKLLSYDWPGNVRELANVIERAIVMDREQIIHPDHLYLDAPNLPGVGESSIHEMEKKLIKETLEASQNKTKAAEILNIDRKTLREKLKRIEQPSG